jgi:hypothetical protein
VSRPPFEALTVPQILKVETTELSDLLSDILIAIGISAGVDIDFTSDVGEKDKVKKSPLSGDGWNSKWSRLRP